MAAGAIVDRDRAEALLHEELELVRRFGAPRPIGVTLTAAGVVRGAEGARSARGDGREAGRLAASRVRPPSRRTTGAEALTPAERRVVELAGSGLTNPEIARELVVTRKTVEWHLSRAYAKLNVRSRRHLPQALARAPQNRLNG